MKNRPTQERAKMNHSDMPEVRLWIGPTRATRFSATAARPTLALPPEGWIFFRGANYPILTWTKMTSGGVRSSNRRQRGLPGEWTISSFP